MKNIIVVAVSNAFQGLLNYVANGVFSHSWLTIDSVIPLASVLANQVKDCAFDQLKNKV